MIEKKKKIVKKWERYDNGLIQNEAVLLDKRIDNNKKQVQGVLVEDKWNHWKKRYLQIRSENNYLAHSQKYIIN